MSLKPGQTSAGVRAKSERQAEGITNRLKYLEKLRDYHNKNESFPDNCFIPKPTYKALQEWEDTEQKIEKVCYNTLKKHPKSESLKKLAKEVYALSTSNKSRAKKGNQKTQTQLKKDFKRQKSIIQSLTDELLTLRAAYCALLDEFSNDKQQSINKQEAIKRYSALYGSVKLVTKAEKL